MTTRNISPEQLTLDCDLAIHVATMRNIKRDLGLSVALSHKSLVSILKKMKRITQVKRRSLARFVIEV